MKINFFGDFVAPSVDSLKMSESLKSIIADADINILNCEAVAINAIDPKYSRIQKTGPNLAQHPKAPDWIQSNGFDVVSLANNHIYDYGESAILDTIAAFEKSTVIGAGNWDEAYKPAIFSVGGNSIAIIALTHCEFGTLVDKWDERLRVGAAWINHPNVDKIIVETRKQVDYLFVFAHAGVEHLSQPIPEWRDRYRAFIDLGCDGIVASHPHIIEGWEYYKGKPIVYSLGNFYFPRESYMTKRWCSSLVATLEIDKASDIHLTVTPISFSIESIDIDTSEETERYILETNNILADDERYVHFINKESVDRMETYYTMFLMGGFARCYTLKKILRAMSMFLFKKFQYNPAWLYNNIQSESHRWIFLRGFKLLNKLK